MNKYNNSDDNYDNKIDLIPRRLIIVKSHKCDFNNCNNDNECKSYILPYNNFMGINACNNHRKSAIDNCYNYCLKNQIYPVNDNIILLICFQNILKLKEQINQLKMIGI
jgi:hypothetical protein